jgi:hypothetical protein
LGTTNKSQMTFFISHCTAKPHLCLGALSHVKLSLVDHKKQKQKCICMMFVQQKQYCNLITPARYLIITVQIQIANGCLTFITLFKFITILCRTNNIMHNIVSPQNVVIDYVLYVCVYVCMCVCVYVDEYWKP